MFKFEDCTIDLNLAVARSPRQAFELKIALDDFAQTTGFENTALCALIENCEENEPILLSEVRFADMIYILSFYTSGDVRRSLFAELGYGSVNLLLSAEGLPSWINFKIQLCASTSAKK